MFFSNIIFKIKIGLFKTTLIKYIFMLYISLLPFRAFIKTYLRKFCEYSPRFFWCTLALVALIIHNLDQLCILLTDLLISATTIRLTTHSIMTFSIICLIATLTTIMLCIACHFCKVLHFFILIALLSFC
jgi:hypothetical protein